MTDRTNTRADRFAIMDAGMAGILPAFKLCKRAGQVTRYINQSIH
ncbi:MAG: hypothetical protein Q8M19_24955 [Reyranella sp.]|nr:hypothetical protein [Reyranella sp.]